MAYQVDKFNGDFLVSVDDGTIDTTTDLRLVGKNYAGYGEVQNENFLHLLESFANTSPPSKAIAGQIWFDSDKKRLRFYDGTKFKIANGAEASSTAPSGLAQGEFWWDTTNKQLKTWSGTEFIVVGPAVTPTIEDAEVTVEDIPDTTNNLHRVIKFTAAGATVAIVSNDAAFTPNISTNINSTFPLIKKGINVSGQVTDPDTGVVTSSTYKFWGTSSNADSLGGFPANEFLRVNTLQFNNQISFRDPGFALGNDNDLRVFVDSVTGELTIETLQQSVPSLNLFVSTGPDNRRKVAVLTQAGFFPGSTNAYNLGSANTRWNNLYASAVLATTFTGALQGNSTGTHIGDVIGSDSTKYIDATLKEIGYVGATIRGTLFGSVEGNLTGTASQASTLSGIVPSIAVPSAADKTSVVVRDSGGKIAAAEFTGTATFANRLKIDNSATDTDPVYKSAKTTATANTIAARNDQGNLFAVLFEGTATAARYADLAEKYLADADYEAGTVVCIGGEKEVTASSWGKRAIGVVSTNPAFMMNKDLEGGTYVALKGRVPVKVIGRVKKGDELIAANNGCAMMAVPHASGVFAVALESNDNEGIKVIEALVL